MIRLEQISKSFAGVHALKNVSLEFAKGEIHALCGENGAGKSTLMSIITGNIHPDAGKMLMDDQPVYIRDVRHAQELGISIVYQEGSLSEALNVAENIFPNRQPVTSIGTINYKQMHSDAKTLLAKLHIDHVDTRTPVYGLNAEQRKMVEIAKALALKPSFLILDEPTAPVSSSKTEAFFEVLRRLKKDGVTVVYISHRMDEIMKIADRVSVLKDGVYQGTLDAQHTTIDQVIRMMVGRELLSEEQETAASHEICFETRNLSGAGFTNVSFRIFKGEIFGLAGLQGSGRTALARAIFGDLPATSGTMLKNNQNYSPSSPAAAMHHKVAYIPEDRKTAGLFIDKSIHDNVGVVHLTGTMFDDERQADITRSYVSELEIKTSSVFLPVKNLSGGNQQKVVLAKWLSKDPDLLVVNEPTHGVDIGAKSEIYRLLRQLTRQGKTILLVSSDLPELLLLSNRIGVMYKGELKKIFSRSEVTEELITSLASGM